MATAASGADADAAAPRTVLVYTHSWLPGQVDGVAVRIMAHVQALARRGTKVVVVTPDFVPKGAVDSKGQPMKPPVLTPIECVEHVTVPTRWTPVYRKVMCMDMTVRTLFVFIDLIRKHRPDYVHATQETMLLMIAFACLLFDVPLVSSMHTDVKQIAARDDGFSPIGGRLGRLHADMSVRFIDWGYSVWSRAGTNYLPVSKHARHCLRSAKVPEEYITKQTWGPMVDREVFRIDQPKEKVQIMRDRYTFGLPDAFLMVYVGRVTAEKDIQFLVDSLEYAPKNVVLALVGPGSMTAELSKKHGKEHRIHCTGEMVSREDVAAILRAADCCVSASTMETVGFTAMETLSCGTPMLAANAQGFAEHLSHDVNARLWTPHDAEHFQSELRKLMVTKPEGQWAPEALRESIAVASVDACTDRCLEAYLSVGPPSYRWLRIIYAFIMLVVNYVLATLIH